MHIISKLIKIKNNNNPSTEYIEGELTKQKITPIRWAIVAVDEEYYTISLANQISE